MSSEIGIVQGRVFFHIFLQLYLHKAAVLQS